MEGILETRHCSGLAAERSSGPGQRSQARGPGASWKLCFDAWLEKRSGAGRILKRLLDDAGLVQHAKQTVNAVGHGKEGAPDAVFEQRESNKNSLGELALSELAS